MSPRGWAAALFAAALVLGVAEASNGPTVSGFGAAAVLLAMIAVVLLPLDDPSDQ